MTGIVLLAAGASVRMGEPKQQLLFQGKTLLQRATQAALESVCTPIAVVLGANAEILCTELGGEPVIVVQNEAWQEGMASSLRSGLQKLLNMEPAITSCLFMVCDQPYVTAAVLDNLVQQKKKNEKGIIASAYHNTLGTPVLFDKKYFPALLALEGQEGAKKIIRKHLKDVVAVPFPAGATDIDTAADYAKLLQEGSST